MRKHRSNRPSCSPLRTCINQNSLRLQPTFSKFAGMRRGLLGIVSQCRLSGHTLRQRLPWPLGAFRDPPQTSAGHASWQAEHRLASRQCRHPPIYFLNIPLEEVQSFQLLGLTISHDLSLANHISRFSSKPVTDWASSVIQSLSLAHLNSHPPTKPSSAA